MSLSMHAASVPVFRQMLAALAGVLAKAETHASERKIDPVALLQARLFPDMFPLARQVQSACDAAKLATARLSGVQAPVHADTETTFGQLQERIHQTLAFLRSVDAAQIDGQEDRPVTLKTPSRELAFTGQSYLLGFALPNFFFHVTTAYAILRHEGVALGKMDYLG
ncbi:MAG TPA: DUF1993 domain-containing protein, partial [Thermomonas sp.]|nr:DUF1993 domain-containing protein [Thermomonas sp.]